MRELYEAPAGERLGVRRIAAKFGASRGYIRRVVLYQARVSRSP